PPIPREGDDGLFTQSWFPICLAADVPVGTVKGAEFLDGRVVVYRGDDGLANVLSAFCPHLGADLRSGAVVGWELRRAFHHWSYDGQGRRVRTAIGDPAPPTARLYKAASQEKIATTRARYGATPSYDRP